MFILRSLSKKCYSSGGFPKTGLFLIDELFIIFEHSTKESLKLLNHTEIFSAYVIRKLDELKTKTLITKAHEHAQRDPIFYNGIFFEDGEPVIQNICNYFGIKGILSPKLSDIFVEVAKEAIYNKHAPFVGFKGYELAGAIAIFYINYAFKLTSRENQHKKTGKHLNQLSKQIKENREDATVALLQASEAIILAHELKFKYREKNIIEAAKYLLEKNAQKIKKETIERVTKTAIRDNAIKAAKAKHKESNEIKSKVLDEYKQEKIKYEALGKALSKNRFAKKMAEKYNINEATVRKNWLQGIE